MAGSEDIHKSLEGLSPKQEAAALALVSETTIAGAAKKAGVSESSLHRWLKRDDFRRAYLELRRHAVGKAMAFLQRSAVDAARALVDIVQDEKVKEPARISAAKAVLDQAQKGIEMEDMLQRLEVLEDARDSG